MLYVQLVISVRNKDIYRKQCRGRFYSANRPGNATNDFSTEIDGNAWVLLATTWIDGHI